MTTVQANGDLWQDWREFRDSQRELVLKAGQVAHIDLSLRYIDAGTADKGVVLLMHGIPTWGYLYRDAIVRLVDGGYRVIAPDFLGHGFSDRRDAFDRSFQDQARAMIALLDALSIESAHVVGHDTGGAVALILAIEHAPRVDRLVVCNAVCFDRFDDDMLDLGHPNRWKSKTVEVLRLALEESLAVGLSNKGRLSVHSRDGILAPWLSEEGTLSLIRNAAALNANQTMALVDRHETIAAPTLVLWGTDDPWQLAADGKRLAAGIPGAVFQPIENASHWVQQDAPDAFVDALLSFLSPGPKSDPNSSPR